MITKFDHDSVKKSVYVIYVKDSMLLFSNL